MEYCEKKGAVIAPVVIFVYARPEHTKKTIESLANNYLADMTEVYIYSDAAKNEKAIHQVEIVREYIDSLLQRELFKSITIIKAESNKGLARSVISGVTSIIEKCGRAIIVEDDLVSSPDFLQYMNEALDYYESDHRIWSISGYTFNIEFPKDYTSDIYLSYRGSSWGYATWKDRWDNVDWEVLDYPDFRTNKKLRNRLNRGGSDMANMLDMQMQGKIDSWAIRWCYAQSKLDMLTVYPVVSRIKNIGLDGSGTHSGITSKYDTVLNDNTNECKFESIDLDLRIVKAFKDHFGPGLYYEIVARIPTGLKNHIKRLLKHSSNT